MSESKEKKPGQAPETEELSAREKRAQRRQEEAKEARRSQTRYLIAGIACAALAVFAVVWSTGLLQRVLPAMTINGRNYSAADVQYYFAEVRSMYVQYGLLSSSTSVKDTVYNSETGETWYDQLMNETKLNMAYYAAVSDAAKKAGYTLTESYQAGLDQELATIDESWASYGYASRDAMIRANYGSYMTYDHLKDLLTESYLVRDYASSVITGFEYDDEALQDYYDEHANELDTFTVTQFVFQASLPTTDEDGNTIERTDEEKTTQLEAAKTEQKALAEELQARLEAGEDAQALADEYADQLYSSVISQVQPGSAVNSSYSEWLYDTARKDGDITLSEYEGTSTYNYYVVRFEGRTLDETPSVSVRHILLQAEDEDGNVVQFTDGEGGATEEQKAAVKAEADDLLAQWKAGEATEDSFADLAKEHSTDTGSAANGGLITDITPSSSLVENFLNWSVDPSRKPGDTGIVESPYGWHILYFVGGDGDPQWKLTAKQALRSDDASKWQEEVSEGYEAKEGLGLKFFQT